MQVLLLCGSASDLPVMKEATALLQSFGVSYALHVASAHRTPQKVEALLEEAESAGCRVVICAAGMAAHLAGAVAARTTLPVIGLPLGREPFGGLDSLLSTVQMPPGVPVATVSVGKPGAVNAALLAVQVLALSDQDLGARLLAYRREKAAQLEATDPKERHGGET